MRRGDRVKELYAFLTIDPETDCEGIPAASVPMPDAMGSNIQMLAPLVAADPDRVASLREMAIRLARLGHCRMRLVRFTHMETIEDFGDYQ